MVPEAQKSNFMINRPCILNKIWLKLEYHREPLSTRRYPDYKQSCIRSAAPRCAAVPVGTLTTSNLRLDTYPLGNP